MVENIEENIILDGIINELNYYEKIIVKIFRKLFIKCYNMQRIRIANIFLN